MNGTEGGIRTRKLCKRLILSQLRMPIPPPRHIKQIPTTRYQALFLHHGRSAKVLGLAACLSHLLPGTSPNCRELPAPQHTLLAHATYVSGITFPIDQIGALKSDLSVPADKSAQRVTCVTCSVYIIVS